MTQTTLSRRGLLRASAAAPALAVPSLVLAHAMPAKPATAAPERCHDLAMIQPSVEYEIVHLAISGCLSIDEDHPKLDRLYQRLGEIESQIAMCPALTLAGLQAKASVLSRMCVFVKDGKLTEGASEQDELMFSLTEDLHLADHSDELLRTSKPIVS